MGKKCEQLKELTCVSCVKLVREYNEMRNFSLLEIILALLMQYKKCMHIIMQVWIYYQLETAFVEKCKLVCVHFCRKVSDTKFK